jgi:hypothetical protein
LPDGSTVVPSKAVYRTVTSPSGWRSILVTGAGHDHCSSPASSALVARGAALKLCVEHTVRDRVQAERHTRRNDADRIRCQAPTLRRSEGAEEGHPGSAARWQWCSLRAWSRSVFEQAFDLVRGQSLWSVEAAHILHVQGTTVNRGLHRSLQLLAEALGGLIPNESISCLN